MPAADATTVQKGRSGRGDGMEIPRSAARVAASGSEQQGRSLRSQLG